MNSVILASNVIANVVISSLPNWVVGVKESARPMKPPSSSMYQIHQRATVELHMVILFTSNTQP